MSQLPSSWATAPLLAVCDLVRGVTYTKDVAGQVPAEGHLPVLRANNLQGREFELSDLVYVPRDLVSKQQQIRAGDVVIATSSGSISVVGKAVQARQSMDAGFGAFCGVLRPASTLDARYFGHYFSSEAYRSRVSAMARGSNINNLKREHFESLSLPVAPLAEQRRVADKLDTVLARVDACRDRLARVAPLLKRFRQAVLAAATSGRLTEDWRGATAEPWAHVSIDSLCSVITDGPFGSHLKSDDYADDGARVVRLENIGHLTFDRSKQTFISMQKYASLERHTLVGGDLLFSSFVDEDVRVCAFPEDLGSPAINKADCFCLRVDRTKCDPSFLMYSLACKATFLSLREQVHGATRPRINLGQLRRFKISLPSQAEQVEIVRRVETLFAFADRLGARLAAAQTAVDRLTPSLLAKAFRGELVPQDPADEPAAELLKRLAAQRSTEAAAAPARRARKAKVSGAA